MSEFLQQFEDDIRAQGIVPLEPLKITGDKWGTRCKIEGDKGTARSLRYRISVEGDFAVGGWINSKDGVTHDWHFAKKGARKLSQDEIGERQRKAEADKAKDAADMAERYKRTAKRACSIWERASTEGTHEYLTIKGIDKGLARISGQSLIIPRMKNGKIVNLEFIKPDKEKRPLTGAEIMGCFCPLVKTADRTKICIVEGFATGMSIHMATGLPVMVAFFAANLVPVAVGVRKKYPDTEIIMCADDDAFTIVNGKKDNPGIRWAKAALSAVGGPGRLVTPSFANEHPDRSSIPKPTDFNDMHKIYGLEAVRIAVMEPAPEVADEEYPLPEYDEAGYTEHLLLQYSGSKIKPRPVKIERSAQKVAELTIVKNNTTLPKPDSYSNIVTYLLYHPELNDCFYYDEFSHTVLVRNCPVWSDPADFSIHALDDFDVSRCRGRLEYLKLFSSKENVKAAIEEVAQRNRIHPARDYFNSLEWDGVPRLNNWLIYYAGCEKDELEYVQAVGRKWLIAAVARVMQPGIKFDYMLVLEGNEGARKSTMLEVLATIGGESYFTDALKVNKIGEKDCVIQAQGKLIVEFAEFSGLNKTDMQELKRWITIKQDEMVGKYKSYNSMYKRQFITAATLNPLSGWLDDPTGGRRFWPVHCGAKINIDALEHDKEQLWAEAVAGYKAGEDLWLEGKIWDMSGRARDMRRVEHPWQESIQSKFGNLNNISTNEVFDHLKIDVEKRNRVNSGDIAKIMRQIGFTNAVRKLSGRSARIWVREEAQTKMEYDDEADRF